ncbi:hypothetical protein [Halopiger xanaduensis]|uniref:Uncharacterized protein n=1 Tax=Halopiger xanaduensis (strain DSM 18323 / JCM 14033 / SH-6) TaxID=797210 RepID=F8DBY7_HALXS|nr:hypothetical protein [Halopiger xanaduensis]AEH35963.1 hypothetical protein Halxa_1330 [Halopiger xanaduensis SH-6]
MSEFVRANRLYDVENRTPIAHPAHQASDADVRRALEERDDREIRTDGGTDSSERYVPVTIDGERVPAEQVDRFDGDVIVSVPVASAVSEGFDFSGIWRCKRVTVKIFGREFAATIAACSIEHGVAGIQLTECESFESGAARSDNRTDIGHSPSHSENSTRRQGGDSGR